MKKQTFTGFEQKQLAGYVWDNVKNAKAVVQIIHGMQEHAQRYDHFANYLNKNGYITVATDLRGHGQTAGSIENLGKTDGDIFTQIVSDQIIITNKLKQTYNLPVIVFGHSFGSFVTQRYIQQTDEYSKAIICGSNYTKGLLISIGAMLSGLTATFKGKDATAKLVETLSFGPYKKPFENGNWLTRDTSEFNKYVADPYCGTPFSAGFYKSMLKNMGKNYKHLKKINTQKPIMLIAGDADPVGGYGKGVKKLHMLYKSYGLNVSMHLYKDMRHEILNEIDKEIVYKNITDFLNGK